MRRRDFIGLLPLSAVAALTKPDTALSLPAGRMLDVVVVGGGIAGLCAAYELDGLDLALFEAQPRVGGRAIDRMHNGWSYPLGAYYLGRPYGVLARVLQRTGLRPVEIARPTDAVFDNGRLYLGEAELVRQMTRDPGVAPYNRLVRALRQLHRDYEDLPDYRPGRRLGELDRITARAWLQGLDMPPVIMDRLEVLARGLFGAGLDQVSALGTLSEFAYELAESDLLESSGDIDDIAREAAREGSGVYTIEGGVSRIAQALAQQLGNRVHTGEPVQGIQRDGDGFSVRLRGGVVSCRGLIMATPAPVTLALAGGLLTPRQRAVLQSIDYTPAVTAALFSDEPLFDQAFNLSMPPGRAFTDLYDCTWVQRRNLGRKGDGRVLGVHAPNCGNRGRNVLDYTDRELIDRFTADLRPLVDGVEGKIRGFDIQRHRLAFPLMPPGAYERLSRLHAQLEDSPLQLAGDYLIYPTFEAAADSGEMAAERLREAL